MTEINRLCLGCMNEKESDGPCEKCGYSNDAPYLPSYLAPGTILNDRYIVGKLLSYNGEGATYIGFDKVTGAKVTVKEYMPDTLCSRKKGDPQIVVDANRLPLYKTYMSEFVELNKALLKARSMTHIQYGICNIRIYKRNHSEGLSCKLLGRAYMGQSKGAFPSDTDNAEPCAFGRDNPQRNQPADHTCNRKERA